MKEKVQSLLFKFGVVFGIFTAITIIFSGFSTYISQNDIYLEECENSIQQLASHLERAILRSPKEYAAYQDIMIKYHDDIDIPVDFDNYVPARDEFQAAFEKRYPGKLAGVDIEYTEMPKDLQLLFAKYQQERWLLLFEEVRESFSTSYTYYVVPTGQQWHMYYLIDGIREPREKDKKHLELCIDAEQEPNVYPKMWQAMESGLKPNGSDSIDNEMGKTYAFFNPLVIDGRVMGVIAVELDVAAVNDVILRNTLQQTVKLSIILILAMAVMLYCINHYYISKLSSLKKNIGTYANYKNADIVENIEKIAGNGDEISELSMQVSEMILELDNYMDSLVKTTNELSDTREKAENMRQLAHRDALTGVRNKTAYDQEMKKLNWKIDDGFRDFAIGMVDLNYLKRINDTYGHEQGNSAIRSICRIICETFKHSPVFRIGGDEFVVIFENEDFEQLDEKISCFEKHLEELAKDPSLEPWESVSAAIGVAVFDPKIDSDAANVFKRADKRMYARKKEMKAERKA